MFSAPNFQGPKPIDTFENIKCIHKNLQECGFNEENTDLKSMNTRNLSNVLVSKKKKHYSSPSPKKYPISSFNFNNVNEFSMIKSEISRKKMPKSTRFKQQNNKSKAINQFSKINRVRMAIKKFLEYSRLKKVDDLTSFHFNMISDVSYHKRITQKKASMQGKESNSRKIFRRIKNEIFSSVKKKLKLFCKKTFIKIPKIKINPRLQFIWDILILIIIISEFFHSTIDLSFEIEEEFNQTTRLRYYIEFVFLAINSIIRTHSNVYESGLPVVDNKKIFSNYFKTFFLADIMVLISIFPLETLYKTKITRLLFIFVYKTVKRIIENVREFFEENCKEDLFDFWYLLFKMMIIAHLLACAWHAIGYYFMNIVEFSWLTIDGKYETDWLTRYIMSIYWAFTTMSTVGYGDITPQNSGERLFCIIAMMLGAILFGYLVNTVGGILNRMEEKSKELVYNTKIADNFMRRKNIDISLRVKVKKYLEYLWQNEYKSLEKEEEIIGKLPVSLRNEILLESNLKFLKKFSILSANFSPELVEYLALNIKPVQYSPDEIILDSSKKQEPSLYLISEGEIEIYIKKHTKKYTVKILKKGEIFGERNFFFNSINLENAQSRAFSTIYKISQHEFFEFLASSPKDYQKFCEIKDMCTFSKNYENLMIKCHSCGSKKHFIEECPLLTYYPNKDLVIDRLNYSKPQVRKTCMRKNRKNNAFLSKKNVAKSAMHVRFNKSLMTHFKDNNNNNNLKNDSENINKSMVHQNKYEEEKHSESNLKEFNDNSIFWRSKSFPEVRATQNFESFKEKKIKSLFDFKDPNLNQSIDRIFDLEKNEITKMYQSTLEENLKNNENEPLAEEEEKESSHEIDIMRNLNKKKKNDQESSLILNTMELSPKSNKKMNKNNQSPKSKRSSPDNSHNEILEDKINLLRNSPKYAKFDENVNSISWKNIKRPTNKKQSNSPGIPIRKNTSKKLTNKFHNTLVETKTLKSTLKNSLITDDELLKTKLSERRKKEMFFADFEAMKEYENYFIAHNFSHIFLFNNSGSRSSYKKTQQNIVTECFKQKNPFMKVSKKLFQE